MSMPAHRQSLLSLWEWNYTAMVSNRALNNTKYTFTITLRARKQTANCLDSRLCTQWSGDWKLFGKTGIVMLVQFQRSSAIQYWHSFGKSSTLAFTATFCSNWGPSRQIWYCAALNPNRRSNILQSSVLPRADSSQLTITTKVTSNVPL